MSIDWSAPVSDEVAARRAGGRRKINAGRRSEALARMLAAEALAGEGWPVSRIAQRLGVSRSTAYAYLQRACDLRAIEVEPLPASAAPWVGASDDEWMATLSRWQAEGLLVDDEDAEVVLDDGDDEDGDDLDLELDAEASRMGLLTEDGEADGGNLVAFIARDPTMPLDARVAALVTLRESGRATPEDLAAIERIRAALLAKLSAIRAEETAHAG
jgi:hypothetical protein